MGLVSVFRKGKKKEGPGPFCKKLAIAGLRPATTVRHGFHR